MKAKEYELLSECVSRGVALGYERAHKHTDKPTKESLCASISKAVMLIVGDYFTFEDSSPCE